jgi:Transposase DDE domain group 1
VAAPRAVHSPGKIITDLAVAVALGGDCVADVAVVRAQPELAGLVASDPVISRLVTRLAADAPKALKAIRAARAAAGSGPGTWRAAPRPPRMGAWSPWTSTRRS